MNRTLAVLSLTLLCALALLGFRGFAQSEHQIVNLAGDTPTNVQRTAFSEGQRRRGQAFPAQERSMMGLSLLDAVDPSGGGFVIEIPERAPDPEYYSRSLNRFFSDLFAEADVVIVGHVVSKHSDFTDGFRWIYTDYDFQISEVLKSSNQLASNLDRTVTVVGPGGTVVIEGREIYALDQSCLPLVPTSDEYLLFLTYVPDIDAYIPLQRYGAFRTGGVSISPMTDERLPITLGPDANSIPPSRDDLLSLLRTLQVSTPHPGSTDSSH